MKIIAHCSECEPGTPEVAMEGATEAACGHCGLVWRRTVAWREGGEIAKAEYVYVANDGRPTQKAGFA